MIYLLDILEFSIFLIMCSICAHGVIAIIIFFDEEIRRVTRIRERKRRIRFWKKENEEFVKQLEQLSKKRKQVQDHWLLKQEYPLFFWKEDTYKTLEEELRNLDGTVREVW